MIPYLCEELPAAQKAALASANKVPLLYSNVLLRNCDCVSEAGSEFDLRARRLPYATSTWICRSASVTIAVRARRKNRLSCT